jgi:hypothetical protein
VVGVVLLSHKEFMGRSACLYRVFTMKNRLPQNVSGALPHRIAALEASRPLHRG